MTKRKARIRRSLEDLDRVRLISVLAMLLTFLKAMHPKIYRRAERQLRLSSTKGPGGSARKTRTKSTKRASPAQARTRRKFKAFVKQHGRGPHKGEHL